MYFTILKVNSFIQHLFLSVCVPEIKTTSFHSSPWWHLDLDPVSPASIGRRSSLEATEIPEENQSKGNPHKAFSLKQARKPPVPTCNRRPGEELYKSNTFLAPQALRSTTIQNLMRGWLSDPLIELRYQQPNF